MRASDRTRPTDVHLRLVDERDDPRLLELFADPGVQQWNPGREAEDLPAWRARVRAEHSAGGGSGGWVVADADDLLLGTISLFDVDLAQGTGEVGYRVHPAERGRGVASAALRLLAARAHDEVGLRRLQLFHALDNPASCGVARRAGFALEGTLRAAYVYGDGVAHDEHLHARLATDPR